MARGFVSGLDYDQFKEDYLRLYAVVRCLEIISEASRRLPDALKARHSSIDWRAMAGAGNIYRHDYEDVTARRVWRTITLSLPALLEIITLELAGLSPSKEAR